MNEIYMHMSAHRQTLHKIPELSMHLPKTKSYIYSILKNLGYTCIDTAVSGIIAYKNFNPNFKSLMFRADMDGLPQNELTNLSFSSVHKNQMHACGHDGHMSILLGLAEYLSNIHTLQKNIIIVFQPGEEDPGGAEIIVKENILQNLNIEACFGLHIFPTIPEGKIALKSGPQMARCCELDLNITGKSAHGAMPHLGSDALLAFSYFHTSIQSILSRRLSPFSNSVISIGKVEGGTARNIIAENITANGTIRTFDDSELSIIKTELSNIAMGIGHSFNVTMDLNLTELYPAVINDEMLFQKIITNMDKSKYIISEALMTAEDFSYYQEIAPSMFFLLGSYNEDMNFTSPLHSSYFDFSDKVLNTGLNAYIDILKIFDAI